MTKARLTNTKMPTTFIQLKTKYHAALIKNKDNNLKIDSQLFLLLMAFYTLDLLSLSTLTPQYLLMFLSFKM
jgi:hypothetical protein